MQKFRLSLKHLAVGNRTSTFTLISRLTRLSDPGRSAPLHVGDAIVESSGDVSLYLEEWKAKRSARHVVSTLELDTGH